MNSYWRGLAGFSVALVAAMASNSQSQEQVAPAGSEGIEHLRTIASGSQCAAVNWNEGQRGTAPSSYIEGVALVFARAICRPQSDYVQVVSAPVDTSPHSDDALEVYRAKFQDDGMRNDTAGVDTLRHSFTLMIGLGMMESSGRYCEGRDVSQCFADADSAEAGLFQTSFGVHHLSPVLLKLFQSYNADQKGCLLNVFRGSITCEISKSHNSQCLNEDSDVKGEGPGADWQRLTKTCPAFATEYGAVVLRKHGGPKGEFNPIRKQQAELRPECDDMLHNVQTYVEQHPEVCSAL